MGLFMLSGFALFSVLDLQNMEAFWKPCFSLKIHCFHYISRLNASCETGQQFTIISVWLKLFHDVYMENASGCTSIKTVIQSWIFKERYMILILHNLHV